MEGRGAGERKRESRKGGREGEREAGRQIVKAGVGRWEKEGGERKKNIDVKGTY